MRSFRHYFFATATIAALLSILSVPAFADSYQVLALSNDAFVFIDGIYPSGAVVLMNGNYVFGDCSDSSTFCYITYVNGLPFSGSNTAPSIPFGDGGTIGGSCPPVPSNIPSSTVLFAFCTNGDVVYGNDRYINPDGSTGGGGIFTSDGSTIQYVGGVILSPFRLSIDSYGDIVWDDEFEEKIYEAYDVTTHLGEVPEPGSWSLVAIGMLAGTMLIRKRQFC